MKNKKITIKYQPTEPVGVYTLTVFVGKGIEEIGIKMIHSNIDSLLNYEFKELNYERWDFEENTYFIPTKEQPLNFLKKREYGESPIKRVEIRWDPLYR